MCRVSGWVFPFALLRLTGGCEGRGLDRMLWNSWMRAHLSDDATVAKMVHPVASPAQPFRWRGMAGLKYRAGGGYFFEGGDQGVGVREVGLDGGGLERGFVGRLGFPDFGELSRLRTSGSAASSATMKLRQPGTVPEFSPPVRVIRAGRRPGAAVSF